MMSAGRPALRWLGSTANTFQFSGVPQSTAASTGAAAALPAAPNRYLTIQFNGNLLKIPAYTVSGDHHERPECYE